ncbi:unnamed protein product [Adineta ricciae]|uniref:Innexin n=1 Tax=Adineta ricciae TaxID=249248 RepID=A0A815QYM8_ADIRI|nr:unnamed protein product [Adineta ricciae]
MSIGSAGLVRHTTYHSINPCQIEIKNDQRECSPYYQWVPFILFTMMILFYVPGFIWRKLNRNCGIDTKVITNSMLEMDPLNSEQRKEAMLSLAKHIDRALTYHREYHHGFIYSTWKRFSCLLCCTVGRRSGNYLAFGYIIVKLLYIANAVGQLFLLNVFLGNGFQWYGLEILKKWFYGQEIEAVERFPRITMCRFILRTLGDNIQPYDVQCLLPNNIYNEKIFLFLWFWLAFVAVASIYGLLKWFHYFTLKSRKDFIRCFLKANGVEYYSENVSNYDIELLRTFVDSYCRQDGILLLRIITANMNNVLVGELICALWENWQLQRKIHINTLSERIGHRRGKLLDDHDDSNNSTLVESKTGTLTVHDDRYVLLPPRI